jgi:hypothetical protein
MQATRDFSVAPSQMSDAMGDRRRTSAEDQDL